MGECEKGTERGGEREREREREIESERGCERERVREREKGCRMLECVCERTKQEGKWIMRAYV